MSMQGTLSAAERSIRSVFVGNIPYEATEEQLKDIFSEVGPVISFRLVYDRESGKPKGYGFCEYKDQDTALSAMRNLNGYELNGRALRVDNAASEKNKEELRNLQASVAGPPVESPYGAECDPDKAPEAISKAVASLPPEQMFELMKQMKSCIQNNPNEARNMLLLNPQLAYALLQAQVVMRIVEPQVAMGMLMRPNTDVRPLHPPPAAANDNGPPPSQQPPPPVINHPSGPLAGSNYNEPPYSDPRLNQPVDPVPRGGGQGGPIDLPRGGGGPPMMGGQFSGDPRPPPGVRDYEMRGGDPRGGGVGGPGFDQREPMRMGPGAGGPGMGPPRDPRDPRDMPRDMPRDPRSIPHDAELRPPNFDPRRAGDPRSGARGPPADFEPRGIGGPPFGGGGGGGGGGGFPDRGGFESRSPIYEQQQQQQPPPPQPRDPRSQGGRPPMLPPQSGGGGGGGGLPIMRPGLPNIPPSGPPMGPGGPGMGPKVPLATQDQEKAALIMQVLQLSEQQIAMLPPEQRQSIMVLKEQIARSTQNQ